MTEQELGRMTNRELLVRAVTKIEALESGFRECRDRDRADHKDLYDKVNAARSEVSDLRGKAGALGFLAGLAAALLGWFIRR